jgi:hypothetical protein
MMPLITVTLVVDVGYRIAVVASVKISSVLALGVCWKIGVSWG